MTSRSASKLVHGVGLLILLIAVTGPFALNSLFPVIGNPNYYWNLIQGILLAATLYALLVYAKDTWRIATLQEVELGLRKRPVVSFLNREKDEEEIKRPGELWTKIQNHSDVHATARFQAFLREADSANWVPLEHLHPDAHEYIYGGRRVWSIQANATFYGNLGLYDSLGEDRFDKIMNRLTRAWICIRSWSAAYEATSQSDRIDWFENPVQYFRWNHTRGRWEPEPDCPKEFRELPDPPAFE